MFELKRVIGYTWVLERWWSAVNPTDTGEEIHRKMKGHATSREEAAVQMQHLIDMEFLNIKDIKFRLGRTVRSATPEYEPCSIRDYFRGKHDEAVDLVRAEYVGNKFIDPSFVAECAFHQGEEFAKIRYEAYLRPIVTAIISYAIVATLYSII